MSGSVHYDGILCIIFELKCVTELSLLTHFTSYTIYDESYINVGHQCGLHMATEQAVDVWGEPTISCIQKSFKKCCISNAMYGTENDILLPNSFLICCLMALLTFKWWSDQREIKDIHWCQINRQN